MITWKNLTSDRVIFAGPINVIGDARLKAEGGGRVLVLEDVGADDSGKFECTVETRLQPISLAHHLNVLGEEYIRINRALCYCNLNLIRVGWRFH